MVGISISACEKMMGLVSPGFFQPNQADERGTINGKTPKMPDAILEIPAQPQDPYSSPSIYKAVHTSTAGGTKLQSGLEQIWVAQGGSAGQSQGSLHHSCQPLSILHDYIFWIPLTLGWGFTVLAVSPAWNALTPDTCMTHSISQ